MRIDAGFSDDIPATTLPNPYAILNGAGGNPGIIFSGNTNPSFGSPISRASSMDWIVGNASFRDTFTPFPPNVIKTSYEYILAFAQRNGITPVNMATPPTCVPGGIANCSLKPSLSHGLYIANGDLTIANASYTFGANEDFVILVNGNLTLLGNLSVPVGSTVTFAVKGDIKVNDNVGNIEGYYSTNKNFIIRDDADDTDDDSCPTADTQLNVEGSIITNASLTGGSLHNHRDLCAANSTAPSLLIKERPDFILNSPQLIRSAQTVWQEIAP